MRFFAFILIVLSLVACSEKSLTKEQQAQLESAKEVQNKLNVQYADKKVSPLTDEDFNGFQSLDFFSIDLKYIIKANFIKNAFPIPFEMETNTDRRPIYKKYGTLYFEIDGVKCELPVYQNDSPNIKEEYKNHIFLPFTDLTNGKESYGGGRYIDLELPFESEVLVDFNTAYNPYCAYNHKYSCVISPEKNNLKVAIKAGVKDFDH